MKIKLSKYPCLVIAGGVISLAEAAYFGWNYQASHPVEQMINITSRLLIIWGVIGDLLSGIQVHKHTNITTNGVEIHGQLQPQEGGQK